MLDGYEVAKLCKMTYFQVMLTGVLVHCTWVF